MESKSSESRKSGKNSLKNDTTSSDDQSNSSDDSRKRDRKRDKKKKNRKERKEKKSKKEKRKDKKKDRKDKKSSRERKLYLKTQIYFIPTMMEHLKKNDCEVLKRIKKDSGVKVLEINPNLHLPDLQGNVVTISDRNRKKKETATEMLVEEYSSYLGKLVHWKEPMRLIILIPEAVVSLFIGYRGHQINKAMSMYGTKIIVNQPISNVSFRTVELEGKSHHLAQTVNYSLAELQRLSREKNINNLELKPRTPRIRFNKTVAKLIFPFSVCLYLNRQTENFLSALEKDLNVEIRIYENPRLPFLRREERILEIRGKLRQVQWCAKEIIRKAHDFSQHQGILNSHSRLMMIIHNSFITKLIGSKGCMIREIAAKSAGAQIKILSSKEKERRGHCDECPVSIAGSLVNKQDALCLILEQIETFKGGGPLLMSGKVLGKNIAEQFKHSVQAKKSYDQMLGKRQSFHVPSDNQGNIKQNGLNRVKSDGTFFSFLRFRIFIVIIIYLFISNSGLLNLLINNQQIQPQRNFQNQFIL